MLIIAVLCGVIFFAVVVLLAAGFSKAAAHEPEMEELMSPLLRESD